jgi:hypothetical protein
MLELGERADATTIPQPPLSFRRVRRRQGSTSQNTNTYYILRTRAEGIRPPAEAVPRTLPDRSLDRAVEGRIGLEKEANRRLARGIWMVVALCAHLNNSENGRHEEVFPYRQLLTRSFWYCAFVHALEVIPSFLHWWSIPPVGEGHSHKALWLHANCCMKCFLRFTRALQHRGIRDPGLFIGESFCPLWFLASV